MALSPGLQRLTSLRDRKMGTQWAVLLVLSIIFFAIFESLRLPAALMLGPMCAGIVIASREGTVKVPLPAFYAAQSMIGCMIARSITPSILGEIMSDWPLFISAVVGVILASTSLGWLLARRQVLPGTTAIWGSAPGAAATMTVMAEAFGADFRLVAFMQYLRVLFVAVFASVISRIWVAGTGGTMPAIVWFPAIDLVPFAETLALAGVGIVAGRLLRIPAGPLLLPLISGVILQDTGLMTIVQPPWLLAITYTALGWTIGLRFTRAILRHVARALPRLALSILTLIGTCGILAAILTQVMGLDPLTAYLATSPGGADTVAIIAASTDVNQPFVMAMQMARFIMVMLTGPALARFLAHRLKSREEAT